MTKQLSDIIERVKTWPAWRQADAAHLLEAMEKGGTEVYRLSEQEHAAVRVGLAQADRGEFVSDADLSRFRNRHRA